jgi:hypothetical protein
MAEDRKLEVIQDEIKLLKGELKQSLASVRDYLLNMELPSSEFSTILAALGSDGEQKITMKGTFAPPQENPPAEPQDELAETASEGAGEETIEDESETPAEDEDLLDVANPLGEESDTLSDDGLMGEDEGISPEDELLSPEDAIKDEEFGEPGELDEEDGTTTPESEMSAEEEQPMDYDKTTAEMSSAIPKVNMLANLINWVAKAKREIGYDQLPTFLEVYGISGHLSLELKELILHFADITAERPAAANNADVWSQSMLSLHGILTGGDAPLHPVIPSWSEATSEVEPAEEEIIEVGKTKEAPVKLKLVFPNGDGKSKEFCIDLNPEVDSDESSIKYKN